MTIEKGIFMAEKLKCLDIWSLWTKGWICIPTAPENESDRFPSELGRFLISRFPGLEKNYDRLCEAGMDAVSIFRSTETRNKPHRRILSYSDLRIPLSPDDYGLILTPETPGKIGAYEVDAETGWERIEKTAQFIKDNLHLIPGTIYIPPLGFAEEGVSEEDAVDTLMALFIENERIKIIYEIKIEQEECEEQEDSSSNVEETSTNTQTETSVETSKPPTNGSLIEDDFDVIEVRLP